MAIHWIQTDSIKIGPEAAVTLVSPLDPAKAGFLGLGNGMQSKMWVKIGTGDATQEDPVMYTGQKEFPVPAGAGVSILGEVDQEIICAWGYAEGITITPPGEVAPPLPTTGELPELPAPMVDSDVIRVTRDGIEYQSSVKDLLNAPPASGGLAAGGQSRSGGNFERKPHPTQMPAHKK